MNRIGEQIGVLETIAVDQYCTILDALKKMDALDMKLLVVNADGKFKSVLSIGDIQRALIKGTALNEKISEILRREITVCFDEDDDEKIKSEMLYHRTEFMPVLNKHRSLSRVVFWKDLFGDMTINNLKVELPVVIMAGGIGSRLKPLTNVIPKPLIPIGNKSIIENIIDNFSRSGVNKFYLIVNYKAEMIENYFSEKKINNIDLVFVKESQPLGTGGSLHFLKDKINTTFFVTNCDILVYQDYFEVLQYHKENNNEITIVGAFKHYELPYGTLEIENGDLLKELREKPNITFVINSGLYILEPHLLEEIPANKFFHITELINKVKDRKGRVGVFPVSEKSWLDIGDWKEYKKTQEHFINKQMF